MEEGVWECIVWMILIIKEGMISDRCVEMAIKVVKRRVGMIEVIVYDDMNRLVVLWSGCCWQSRVIDGVKLRCLWNGCIEYDGKKWSGIECIGCVVCVCWIVYVCECSSEWCWWWWCMNRVCMSVIGVIVCEGAVIVRVMMCMWVCEMTRMMIVIWIVIIVWEW